MLQGRVYKLQTRELISDMSGNKTCLAYRGCHLGTGVNLRRVGCINIQNYYYYHYYFFFGGGGG